MRALAIAAFALALLPAAAVAKTGVSIDSTPDGLTAGEPWDVRFEYIHNDVPGEPRSQPAVVITRQGSDRSLTFPAEHLHNGMWMARVVFPNAGRWTYKFTGFGSSAGRQFFEPATILRPARTPKPHEVRASVGGGDSFPYGWVGGGAALALLACGGLVVRGRKAT